MFSDFSVWCVVPAFNEERLLPRMLQRCSALIDRVIVVDDASGDATAARAQASGDPRVQVLRHATNQGVGAAIRSGYLAALDAGADLVVVMAADDQMDPADLPRRLEPLTITVGIASATVVRTSFGAPSLTGIVRPSANITSLAAIARDFSSSRTRPRRAEVRRWA